MTPDEREALETRAERSLRRGELSDALAAFRALAAAFPDDQSLATRLGELEQSLQPAELLNPKSNFRPEPGGVSTSLFDEAEAHASRGDYANAISIYRKLFAERPDADLIRERLNELFALAKSDPRLKPSPPRLDSLLNDLLARIGNRRR